MTGRQSILFLVAAATLLLSLEKEGVQGHGRLLKPPQRSSLWRFPEFPNSPPNYDDGGLWCGGERQEFRPQRCGWCGDPSSNPSPRPNEHGGTYGQGVIAANYTAGSVIDIEFELTATHNGWFSLQLCGGVEREGEACFWEGPFLPMIDAYNATAYDVNNKMGLVTTRVRLPPGVRCSHCVLRLYYRTAKDWGECEDGSGGMGCGPQEVNLNCADIRIT